MVLSIDELEAAENLDDGRNRVSSLLKLRDSTQSFVVQCLADREIQNEIGQQLDNSSKAYRYNCAVIHQPHMWIQVVLRSYRCSVSTGGRWQHVRNINCSVSMQFSAVDSHGWDSAHNRPLDPKLWLGRVFNSNNKNQNFHNLPGENREIQQLKETISILQEENNKIKRLYKEQLQHSKPQSPANSAHTTPDAALVQQTRVLEQEIGILRAQLASNTQKIRQLDVDKARLNGEVGLLKETLQWERSRNRRPSPLQRQPTVTFDDTTRVFIPIESSRPNRSCCTIL